MTTARAQQISLAATPYYHCVSRCVRRAFLCGETFEHRRGWVEDKLLTLADTFFIDVAAYAVMSNHYHVVLHIDAEQAQQQDHLAIIERWHRLFKGNSLSQRCLQGDNLDSAELNRLSEIVELWRQRLTDISWFMRLINEGIARAANLEDGCTGRFWEGRFKSQALLDEKALLACMAYVDLNPIRAKMAKTPERSHHTAIKKRIAKAQRASSPNHPQQQTQQLLRFAGNPRETMPTGVPCRLTDYLELVDWTGRIIKANKRGQIPASTSPILQRLNIDASDWLTMAQQFEGRFGHLVGPIQSLKRACHLLHYQRTVGASNCSRLLH